MLARSISILVCAIALAGGSLCATAAASMRSGSGAERLAWVRRAAGNFVRAELAGSGAGACAVLYAPLRSSRGGTTCAARWDARLAALLRRDGERALLRSQLRGIATAALTVHGASATLKLAHPLLGDASRLVWSEGCWMLAG